MSENEEKFNEGDLMHIKIVIAYFCADLRMKEDMPKAYAVICGPLKEKVERLYKIEANK